MMHLNAAASSTSRRAIAVINRKLQVNGKSVQNFGVSQPVTRCFSDRLLGYSPMSPSPVAANNNEQAKNIPTAQDVTTVGGVWAPTSAKRDKLAELQTELLPTQATLDQAATSTQARDLHLVDGLHSIIALTDLREDAFDDIEGLDGLRIWVQECDLPDELHQVQWEELMRDVVKECDTHLSALPHERSLQDVRDYLDPSSLIFEEDREPASKLPELESQPLREAELRARFLLLKAVAEHLRETWKEWTAVSDQDIDRAATEGNTLESSSTMPTAKVRSVLAAFLCGSCEQRVDAMWDLLDKDDDGLLDEAEMNWVSDFSIRPVQTVLKQLLSESLDAGPILSAEAPTGWRQRRKETKHRKRLEKMMGKTAERHFRDEVELPHRLRCIYAWANKAHQDDKIQSVMVDESTQGWSGRKRYVELAPKISLAEFREVQSVHATHLNRVGAEFLSSFRKDLWVLQGKGRQNRELLRDCALFMFGVSTVDFVILSL